MTKDYKQWPAQLPLLVVHGTGDKVTDPSASAEFVDKLQKDGKDATFKSFEGALCSPYCFRFSGRLLTCGPLAGFYVSRFARALPPRRRALLTFRHSSLLARDAQRGTPIWLFLSALELITLLSQPGDDKWTEIAALTTWLKSKI